MQDFALAKCVINYNSSPAIVSTIEGIPTIQLDADRSLSGRCSTYKI